MKKVLLLGLLVSLWPLRPAAADDVFYKIGPLELKVPFKTVNAVALYDFIGKRPLAGAETSVATLWKITGDVGAVVSPEGRGAPYIGAHLELGTIVDRWLSLGDVKFGGFGGYDFSGNKAIAGIKSTVSLW